jgi:hypothetical protein
VKRPTPLETLRDLRQRTRESEQTRLATRSKSERRAEEAEAQARQLLLQRSSASNAVRQDEHRRLESEGITAAEGQRRVAWERAERRALEQLSADVDRAMAQRREAAREHELARRALEQAHAELEEVERQLGQRERFARHKAEQAQQESLDEASARRFSERSDA